MRNPLNITPRDAEIILDWFKQVYADSDSPPFDHEDILVSKLQAIREYREPASFDERKFN